MVVSILWRSGETDLKLTSDITVRPIQQMGGDAMVVAAARVSTTGEEALRCGLLDKASENLGLIRYLMKHRHGTPFEHGALTFFVHAPIFVFREWHRHRIGMSYNEESARYKELEPMFWAPRRERLMVPVKDFKPARPQFVMATEEQYEKVTRGLRFAYSHAYNWYRSFIQDGIAREVARTVLPVGIYSSMWVSTNPRALMHFLSLRTRDETARYSSYPQAEIEEAARACEQTLKLGWPLTYQAFCESGRVAP